MLGVTPDSVAVTSVAKKLFDAGYGVGIVTSVAIDDATPGAFYAHVPSRSQYYDIGRQLAECGYQFAAGASLRGAFDKQGNPTDLMKYFDEANVSVSYGLDSIDTTAQRLLVLSPFHKEKQNEIGLPSTPLPVRLPSRPLPVRVSTSSSAPRPTAFHDGGRRQYRPRRPWQRRRHDSPRGNKL